jgi:hypothetical protein
MQMSVLQYEKDGRQRENTQKPKIRNFGQLKFAILASKTRNFAKCRTLFLFSDFDLLYE